MKKTLLAGIAALLLHFHVCRAQTFNEILARPTDSSVTLSVLFDQVVEAGFQYGHSPVNLNQQLAAVNSQPGTPVVVEFSLLKPDTRYYYRTQYRKPGAANFSNGPTRSFHTQRSPGSAFTFLIDSDQHLHDKKGVENLYRVCLANMALDSADFMISLGDMFGDDRTPLETTDEEMRQLHLNYRPLMGLACHSMPFFFCVGNHEGESGYWLDQTPPENIAVYGTTWRKFYFPNPYPNGFYTGNSTLEPYNIGYPENYYAFTWGDALFVVLDVYRDCDINEKPKNWDWTLGKTQYDWFRNTLATSTAKHKLVFAHHNRGQGRGGILPAMGFEWGGYGNKGLWEFAKMRPGWDMPVHQLMVAHDVDIFFQGHDHVYALEELDGLIYQTMPMPSDSTYQIGVTANGDAFNGLVLDGSGHLRVKVDGDCLTVDYIAAYLPQDTLGERKNREVRHSYQVCDEQVYIQESDPVEHGWKAVPNPARLGLDLQVNEAAPYDRPIELFDLRGVKVRSVLLPAGANSAHLKLEGLSPGIHFARMGNALLQVVIIP